MALNLKHDDLPSLLLRIGLAAVFIYAAVASFASPQDWVGYLPHFAKRLIDANLLLHIFSVFELGLALWLLSGKYLRFAGIISALTFVGILLSNLELLTVTFRDIALIFASLALAFDE